MRLVRITQPEYAASPVEGIPTVVHFEVQEYESHYRLNLILSDGGNPQDREELEWRSKEIIETSGYSSPASVLVERVTDEMTTVYSYDFCPLLSYMPKFDLFLAQGFYVKNKITAAALSQLEDIIRGRHESSSLFVLESEFYRTLSTLDLHWH
jgi:hypothetical protein